VPCFSFEEYAARKILFNSASGTIRQEQAYKLVSKAMSEENRKFSWEGCHQRMNALNDSYFFAVDVANMQTGEEALSSKLLFYEELAQIHAGSAQVEAPLTFSFGASNSVKIGAVHKVKEHGSDPSPTPAPPTTAMNGLKQSRPSRGRKSWDWREDPPLTHRQQQTAMQMLRMEKQRLLNEEFMALRQARLSENQHREEEHKDD